MNTNLSRFDFKGHEVRTVVIDSGPWFVAGDLCAALGLPTGAGSGRWLRGYGVIQKKPVNRRDHPDVFVGSKSQSATLISRAGLDMIVMGSDGTEAQLQTWVNRVVMPTIRKYELPVVGEAHVVSGGLSEDELIFLAIEVMERRMDRLAAEKARHQEIIGGLLSCVIGDDITSVIGDQSQQSAMRTGSGITRCTVGIDRWRK